jgi:uncharacterized secreted protein with C-terminal beta-propeller domain
MKTDNKLSFKKESINSKVKKSNKKTLGASSLGLIFFLFVLAFGLLVLLNKYSPSTIVENKPIINLPGTDNNQVLAFSSVEDFKSYLEKAADYKSLGYSGNFSGSKSISVPSMAPAEDMMRDSNTVNMPESATPTRVSETNVQVAGIDEPDIVKTDGKNIFYSPDQIYGIYRGVMPLSAEGIMMDSAKIMPPNYGTTVLQIIKALPASEAALVSKIEKTGNLLLKNDVLVIFSGQEILAYDVKDVNKPEKKWSYKLADEYYLQTARLLDDQIYILTQSSINEYQPCPLKPMQAGDVSIEIACSDIYHPVTPLAIDTNFSALKLDLTSGEVKNKVSFVASSGQVMLDMSAENLFVSYDQAVDIFAFSYKFVTTKMYDLLPENTLAKLSKIQGYEISQSSKMNEFYDILNKWQLSLNKDERLKFETEMQNRLQNYVKENQRELNSTGIIKVALNDFDIVASGSVPGHILNQFSLDEYDGNLRLATTIGENFWMWGVNNSSSVNDVYILDKKLKTIGSIQDLGLGERIYSARFIKDQAYLVTFRQTDPFYVLDLSDPKNPQKKGELKIPGFSSYLHPLEDNKILGVGQEDSKVKLSYFDVSDPSNPKEMAKYLLDEYWTEVSNNHHAFLQDAKHQVFFIPGGQGAYIFSYKDDKLSLEKAIDINNVKRALYINDNLYVLGNNRLRIFDENTWEELKDLSLEAE